MLKTFGTAEVSKSPKNKHNIDIILSNINQYSSKFVFLTFSQVASCINNQTIAVQKLEKSQETLNTTVFIHHKQDRIVA